MTQPTQRPRTCLELGLCQAQFGRPSCPDCEPRALRFAPGVIDGPYRRPKSAFVLVGKASAAIAAVAAWLMGPHP